MLIIHWFAFYFDYAYLIRLCDVTKPTIWPLPLQSTTSTFFNRFIWNWYQNSWFIRLLAHLSQRLMGELIEYQSLRRPSVVCRPSSVSPSTISNIFSSETTGPIKLKFHMETPWDAGTKVCSNGPDHMTKMATMPIYGKNPLKIFFSRTRSPMTSVLGM